MEIKKPRLEVGSGDFGNLDDPALADLPSAIADLDAAGANAAWEAYAGNPQMNAALVKQLRNNPKALVVHTFNLTTLQRAALWQMSDAYITEQLAPLANAIEDNNLQGFDLQISAPTVSINPSALVHSGDPTHGATVYLTCKWKIIIHIEVSN